MKDFLRKNGLILAFAVGKFGLHYGLYHSAYELHRDEYLYLDQANHLAWGFLEVPPTISILAYLTGAMGNSFFWVKFWPVLFGALTVWLTGRIVVELGGRWFAQTLACLSVLVSSYLRINLLFQPNSLEVLYWTASFYLIIRYIHTGKDGYVLGLGALFGLGLLNKYSAGFFVIGTLVGLLLTPHRRLLRKPAFYYAIGIALVLFLPNLIWQIKHRVPFFHHMRLLAENQLQYVKTSDFLQDQLLLCLPAVFVWTVGLASLFLVPGLRKYALVGIVYLTVLLTLILLHGKNYYTVGLYPGLLAFGGVVWERATARGGRVWLRPALLVIPVAVLLPFLPLAYPVWSPEKTATFARKFRGTGILRWEDGQNHPLPQDYADMLGWRELTGKVAAAYQTIPAGERRQTAIICANYGQAGAINYYGKKDGLPRAHSSEASYLLWMPDGLRLKNVIVVDDEPDGLSDHFLSFRQTGRVENPYAREKGTFIIVALGADNVIRNAHYREIREKKKQFGL